MKEVFEISIILRKKMFPIPCAPQKTCFKFFFQTIEGVTGVILDWGGSEGTRVNFFNTLNLYWKNCSYRLLKAGQV